MIGGPPLSWPSQWIRLAGKVWPVCSKPGDHVRDVLRCPEEIRGYGQTLVIDQVVPFSSRADKEDRSQGSFRAGAPLKYDLIRFTTNTIKAKL